MTDFDNWHITNVFRVIDEITFDEIAALDSSLRSEESLS